MSIRKHINELKDLKKTVRTAIKQDLSPYLNPLDYAIRDIFENNTYATFDPNIGSLRLLSGGMECLKNLFWRHTNPLEGVLIQ